MAWCAPLDAMRRESSSRVPLLIRDDESDEELAEVSMNGDLAFENAAVSFGTKVLKKEKQGFLPQLAIVEDWEEGLALGCSAWKDSSSNGLAYLRVVALNFKSFPESSHSKLLHTMWNLRMPWGLRGYLWKAFVGNGCNITPDLYSAISKKYEHENVHHIPHGDVDTPVEIRNFVNAKFEIDRDLERTLPGWFQEHHLIALRKLLNIFRLYRPDINYGQGMNFLAAMLLCHLDLEDAFTVFCNFSCRDLSSAIFTVHGTKLQFYCDVWDRLLRRLFPRTIIRIDGCSLPSMTYISNWFISYFSCLPFDLNILVMDFILLKGDFGFFATALALFKYKISRLGGRDVDGALFLKQDLVPCEEDECTEFLRDMERLLSKEEFRQITIETKSAGPSL